MSEFIVNYQQSLLDEAAKQQKNALVKRRAYDLLMQTCIAAVFSLSVAGNIFFYTHSKNLQLQQDKHMLRYDSLLSVKLLADKELMLIKARLNKYPVEKVLIRVISEEASLRGEKTSVGRK